VLFAEEHRLLPQAFLFGVLHVHMSAVVRQSYLLGQLSESGWWYYFPVAMAVKTPIATVVAIAGAAWMAMARRAKWWNDLQRRWLAMCLLTPALLYTLFLMQSNLNLGLRHILPVYPLAYIAIGIVAAKFWSRILLTIMALALAVESLAAFPNFIPFFNIAVGGSRGGFAILGDSNLDWGQDLKPLSKWYKTWRTDHPKEKFYLCYFGIADPAYYGIDYVNLPGGWGLGPPTTMPSEPGVIAISATRLQGIYTPDLERLYAPLRAQKPMAVIGGSIYLYPFRGAANGH
jgi:hypothetical protein